MKYIKKVICLILTFTILVSSLLIVSSAQSIENDDNEGIMPCFTTINTISTSFTISGIQSTSSVVLTAQGSNSLYIKIELQKEKSSGYETIETWTKSGTGTVLSLEKTRLINVLSNYRIKVTCKAGSETNITYDYP